MTSGPPDQRDFVRQKFEWLDQVSRDGGLPGVAVRTAIALTQFFNNQTRQAWPAAGTLADRLGTNVRTVQRSKALLIERGHLTVIGDRRGGSRHTSRVQMRLKLKGGKTINNKEETAELRQGDRSSDETTAATPPNYGSHAAELRSGCRTNSLSEPLEEHSSTNFEKMDAQGWFASLPRPSAARLSASSFSKRHRPRLSTSTPRFQSLPSSTAQSGCPTRNGEPCGSGGAYRPSSMRGGFHDPGRRAAIRARVARRDRGPAAALHPGTADAPFPGLETVSPAYSLFAPSERQRQIEFAHHLHPPNE
jgi:hypothetical protein